MIKDQYLVQPYHWICFHWSLIISNTSHRDAGMLFSYTTKLFWGGFLQWSCSRWCSNMAVTPFWNSLKDDTSVEVLDNPTGNIWLQAGTTKTYFCWILKLQPQLCWQSWFLYNKPHATTTIKSQWLHPRYFDRKRDTQEEYASLIKTTLWNMIWNVNFLDPSQTRKTDISALNTAYW